MSTRDSSRRPECFFVIFLLLVSPMGMLLPSALAGNVDSFSDGEDTKVYDLDGGTDSGSSILVPGDSQVLFATAMISTVPGAPVADPIVDIGGDGSVEWAFTGAGYGQLGEQNRFANHDISWNGTLPNGGTMVGIDVLVPRDAKIESAKVDVKVRSRDTYIKWEFEGLFDIHPQYYASVDLGDLDGDGDLDAVVGGSWGNLLYFENDGTVNSPNWTAGLIMQNQIGNDLDLSYSSVPALVDIDGDNDLDIVGGSGDGTITTFENTGNSTDPKWLANNAIFGSADIGFYASPTFVDIDNDGDQDMLCGEYWGRVAYAENTGSAANPQFDQDPANWPWVNDDGGMIDVGYYAYPELTDLDGDSDFDLAIGQYGGSIAYKNNTGNAGSPSFTDEGILMDRGDPVYVDYMAKPGFADLDNDGDIDLAIGSGYGNVDYYENQGTTSLYQYRRDGLLSQFDAGAEGTPTLGDIDGDGDLDMVVGNAAGDLVFYTNDGNSTSPSFVYSKTRPNVATSDSAPQLVDYDGDADLDIVVGNITGVLTYLKNIGGPGNMVLLEDSTIFGSLDFGSYVNPFLADMDNDGDMDLTIGNSGWGLDYYENTGTVNTPDWDYDGDVYLGLDTGGYRTSPVLYDFDGDGDNDLIIGHVYGTLVYYENAGGPYDTLWAITGLPLERIDTNVRSTPALGDLDGDGDPDIVLSNSYAKFQTFTKHELSNQYDVGLGFFGEPTPIWSTTTTAPVFDGTLDITDAMIGQVPVSASDPDTFGNKMSNVELTLSVDPVGSSFSLHNLNITYSYSIETPDFSDNLNTYIRFHQADVDAEGNLNVSIAVSSSSNGGLNISGIDIEYDGPPDLIGTIPDIEIDEETSNTSVLDLHAYFDDEETSDELMTYRIESNDLNQSIVEVTIFNNRYISVDTMSSNASANWTGSGILSVSAEDMLGNRRLSNEFKLTIKDVNDLPWFTTEPLTTVMADTVYYYDVNASDVDIEDQLEYSFEIAPEGMNINPVTGLISWMPTNADVAIHGIRVSVSDGEATVIQTFSVTVFGNPATNHGPVFTTFPVTKGFVGSNYEYDADAQDSDPGTRLVFELVFGPEQMSLNTETGLLVWDNIIKPYVGRHSISLKVTDGVTYTFQNFTLLIALDPKNNRAPNFVSPPKDFAYPDEDYTYEIRVDDPDPLDVGNLEIWLEVGPKGMKMGKGKTLSWIPSQDDLGEHLVVLGVRDLAGAETLQSFTLYVIKVDGSMAVIILSPEQGEKVNGKFKVVGTLNSSVQNAIQIVQVRFDGKNWKDASGTKTWSASADLTPGQHDIEARAFDGRDYSAVTKISVDVKDEQGIGVGDSGAQGLVVLLLILLVVLVIVSYIIGRKKGMKMASAESEMLPPPALSKEAEEVRAKEERFQNDVYQGREIGPPVDEEEEGGFRGEATPTEEYYQEEPEVEGPSTPEAEPETEAPSIEDLIKEDEPAPGPVEDKPEPSKEKAEKDVLDDILAKLSD